jgi:uncharacterized cupin superfamily protein
MRKVNISDPEFAYDPEDPEGYKAGMFRFGPSLGAEQTGTSVYELPPGQAVCPYHYEYAEEEWLMVLAGRPSLRTPDGTAQLEPMDVVFFPKGPEGAHKVTNETADPVRVMMWSQIITPSATAYPDSDKVGIWTGVKEENLLTTRSSRVGYYHGES